MDLKTLKSAVRNLCPEIDEDDFSIFASHLKIVVLPKGAFFYREGEIHNEIAFISSGILRCFYWNDKGDFKNTRFIAENDYAVDYESLMDQKPSQLNFVALEDSSLVLISRADFYNAAAVSKKWEKFARKMAEHVLRRTQKKLTSHLIKTPEQRYIDFIRERPAMADRIPLYHLASYLGIERESLSRIRKRISKSRM
ncbi:Crp/Fnr family transcriptional regulator [Mucilaginibacter gynuensis]|uniref:Crp/Fnr family transcriptional regulator n=1 Tax=Mucilaginibacter gynuensis TaxID=1302236 RepID=A0ABP8GL25_9SPHI